jgi:adenylate cyclase
LNKDFGTRILIGDSTYAEVKEAFLCRLMGPVLLAGKSGPILVYELMVERQKATATDLSVVEIYARALDCFCHQQWDESLAALDELDLLKPDDGPAKVLRGRIMTCVQDPPDEEWAGVYIRYLKG